MHSFPRLFTSAPTATSRTAMAYAEATPEPAAQQPALPKVRKTSNMPGPLRGLLDKRTAKYERAMAKLSDDTELQQALLGNDMNGRKTRAFYQEAKNRMKNGQWNPQPPVAAGHAQAPIPARTSVNIQAPEPAQVQTPTQVKTPAHAPTRRMRSNTVHPDTNTGSPHAPPSGPVIDPDTGALNKPNLRQLANALADSLPAVPPHANGLRDRLSEQIRAINTIAADGSRASPHAISLAVRDAFAEAAKTTVKLSGEIGGGKLADTYKGVAALLNELKRTHLSAGAHDILNHYAGKEAANLERKTPGIGQGKGGSNVVTGTTAGLTYSLLPKTGYAGPDVAIGAGGGKGRLYFADDDGDIDHWPSLQAYLKATLGGKLGKWVARLAARLDLLAGSTWFEHNDLREMVKLVANNDANHAWMPSAGPNARKVRQALETLANTLSTAVGRNYTEAAGKPLFLNDEKIAKGYNAFKRTLLAAAIDDGLGGTRFSSLMSAAYPSTSTVLGERVRSRGQRPLPLPPRHDVPDSVGYADGSLYYRQATASVDASVGNQTHGGTNLEANGAFGLNLRGNVAQYFMEFGEAPHAQLDPGHQKDYRQVFQQHQLLDDACGNGTPPAQLYLYDRMRRALGQIDMGTPAFPFTQTEQHLYGDAASVPAQFRNAIAHASGEQLNHVTDQLQQLKHTYLRFVTDASAVLSKNDKFMPPKEREVLDRERQAAFERINHAVWQGRYPRKDALAHPGAFIAKSHASLSLALGCAGTHMSVVKQQIAQRHALDQQLDLNHGSADAGATNDAIKQTIKDADSTYLSVRELMDKTYLPLKNYDVRTASPLKEAGIWRRWDTALRAQASGGAQNSLFNTIMSRLRTKSTQVPLGDLTGTVSVSNSAGQVALAAEARLMYADHQLNPSRTGKFWQFTFTAQGGAPISGALINQAVKAAIEKFMPNMRLEDEKFDPHELIRQTQGLMFDITDGTSIVVKLRQAPDVENAAMQLQYVRVLRNKSSGLNVSMTIPTPAGTFTPSISHTDSGQSLAGEIVGSDKSYLIMQHPAFSKTVDPFLARIEAQPNDAADIAAELRQALDADTTLRNRYLASPTMMADVLQEHAAAMEELATAAAENRPPKIKNEFLRYYAAEPFARVNSVATQVASHAPGSTANGQDPFTIAKPLSERFDVSHLDLPAMRAQLQALKTIEDRADYLCGAQGRPLLAAFSKVIGNMRAINSAAFFHSDKSTFGFRSMLRDPGALAREKKQIDAALHGKPAPTSPLGRLRASMQPANTLDAKRLSLAQLQHLANQGRPQTGQAAASEGAPRNQRVIERELARRKERLGDAFPAGNEPAA